jgi:hypothetical protein
MANQKMKISELADQVRNIPLSEVLERYGFEAKPEGTTLRAKSEHHNIVVTGSRWFDNKAGVGGAGAIDLVIHIAKADFSSACRSLADQFRPLAASQTPLSFPKGSRQFPRQEKKSFEELAAIYAVRDDSKWPIACAYLVEKRKIQRLRPPKAPPSRSKKQPPSLKMPSSAPSTTPDLPPATRQWMT